MGDEVGAKVGWWSGRVDGAFSYRLRSSDDGI